MKQKDFYDATGHRVSQDYYRQEILHEYKQSKLSQEEYCRLYVSNLTFYSNRYVQWLEKRLFNTQLALANQQALTEQIRQQRDVARQELHTIKEKEVENNFTLRSACYHHAGRKMESNEYAEELFASAQENETLRNILLRNWEEVQQKKAS